MKETENTGEVDSNESSVPLNCMLSNSILRSFIISPVSWVSCGFEHCLALTIYGTVASWGYGASGCLGHATYVSYMAPKIIKTLKSVVYIETGAYHNAAIGSKGELYMWGRADVGQLGISRFSLSNDKMVYIYIYIYIGTHISNPYACKRRRQEGCASGSRRGSLPYS